MTPSSYRLRLPGPTPVPERVRRALAEPMLNHRGPEFRAVLAEVTSLARRLVRTDGDVLLFGGSGTTGLEGSLANVLAPGERVLAAVNGQFGERFAAIARTLGAEVDVLEVEWGEPVDPGAIERRLAGREYRAVLVTHNETSTGAVTDLAAIGELFRHRSTLLVVDAVSSLGAVELDQQRWHLDVVVAASQKALMCPPGLALVSISPKAWEVVSRDTATPRFALDFRKAKASIDKGETPFTPPVSLVVGLREALRMIHEEGIPRVLARHGALAAALRAGCGALGLPLFPRASAASNAVTVVRTPEGLDGGRLVRHLYERYRTVIAGARNRLAGRVVRIGTMGHVDAADILTDLVYLGRALHDLGLPVQPEAGVAAAAAVLALEPEGAAPQPPSPSSSSSGRS